MNGMSDFEGATIRLEQERDHWRDMLMRYVHHVVRAEGTHFLEPWHETPGGLTEAEIDEIRGLYETAKEGEGEAAAAAEIAWTYDHDGARENE